jgi:CYTH domain-containing protein
MNEIEKTYLVKYLPNDLESYESREIYDIYLPKENPHPALRIRKNGDQYEITKKTKPNPNDSSHRIEETIKLTEHEFRSFEKLEGKRVRKKRYRYPYNGHIAEIDIFLDKLSGLVLADIEFDSHETKDNQKMPEFCLADMTHEHVVAGGLLAGRSYDDIEPELKKYGYKKITRKETK